jgi:hypothetical protein
MKKSNLLSAVCAVLFSLIAMSANATLHGRLPATFGGTDYQAAYDDVLDITWVTNGALSTKVSWQPQVDWAANLNYLGYDDWRLASMAVSAGLPTGAAPSVVSCNSATELACRDNEMGYMFYQNMGGTIGDTLTGNQTVDGVLLSNVQGGYWSGTEYATDPAGAWFFTFIAYPGGHYGVDIRKGSGFSGWAVRDGDVQENPDADGDGVNDDEDLCPDTAPEAAVDAVGCSDAQVDGDGDGVCNDGAVSNGPSTCVGADACPGTVIPEGVPTVRLSTNRWALVDNDLEFDTTAPNGKDPDRSYSTADTGGCSCEQIIGALGLGTGQEKFGCSISTMDGWVALPR